MDKRIMLAVAGSGKTTYLVNQLNLENNFLILTYTQNNLENLKQAVQNKFDGIPKNITIISFYTFLYSYCCKPFLQRAYKLQGIFWNIPPSETNYYKRTDARFYMTRNRYLYHNRISKLLELERLNEEINKRLERYYDHVFIDEIQDFGGHDFNFLELLCQANMTFLLVGDFFQHTFDTSRDGATNRTLHKDYSKYCARLKKAGLTIDTTTLIKSHRCTKSVCNYIESKLGVPISSHSEDLSEIRFIENKEEIEKVFEDDSVVKLFYQESYNYPCYSRNWGEVKGENCYLDICVVLNNSTFKLFEQDKLEELNPQTKNKLYVACSRSKRNLYFIAEKEIKQRKQKNHWM